MFDTIDIIDINHYTTCHHTFEHCICQKGSEITTQELDEDKRM